VQPIPDLAETSNIKAIGDLLYTRYIFFFQLSGIILLIAMIGAIVLTLSHRTDVKRQNIAEQVARDPEEAITMHKVKPGEGI
jgi:NADH-quinone oxidoreductase subunit J